MVEQPPVIYEGGTWTIGREKIKGSQFCFVLFLARQPPVCEGLQCARASSVRGPPHSRGFYFTHNDTPQSVGLLWTIDQLVAETSTYTTHNTHNRQTSTPPVGFELTVSAGEQPQAYALDREATGTGKWQSVEMRYLRPDKGCQQTPLN